MQLRPLNEELAYEREQEALDRHIEILERGERKEEQNSECLTNKPHAHTEI